MLGSVKVLRGMLVLRGIAAAYMAAFHTEAQVHPRIAALEALFASVLVRSAHADLPKVGTDVIHLASPDDARGASRAASHLASRAPAS